MTTVTIAPAGRRDQATRIIVPIVAVALALLVAAVIILVSSLISTGSIDWLLPLEAYYWLFIGAFGSVNGFLNTILQATPLILGGLAVGVGFKAGLFNIGVQGQFLLAGTAAAGVGASLAGAPAPVAITLSIVAGALAGAAWGFVPGALKAWRGANEVVTTIMLNSIAASIIAWLVAGPLLAPGFSFNRTGELGNSALPIIFGKNIHAGVILAFLAVPAMWFLLYRTTLGFEIRAVGQNPSAARYAGMRPAFLIMFTMALSGFLAGIAGASEILGVSGFMIASYGSAVGFDSISVALLGRSNPWGILLAALLFGALRAGAGLMQIKAHVPVEIVDVIQAVILLFLAADIMIQRFIRTESRPGIEEVAQISGSYTGTKP
jgi:general nucleoside transport system permease protein